MIEFERVPALSSEFDGHITQGYLDDQRLITPIEGLNELGFKKIIESVKYFSLDDDSMPISVVNPLVSRPEEPISEFENGIIVRSFGAANGPYTSEQLVLSALVAEITGSPVVNVCLPSRSWDASIVPDMTKPWANLTPEQKKLRGIEHLDTYAAHALESIERFIEVYKAVGKLSFTGESMGAAVALSLAHSATNFDRGNVSISALPNNEVRKLYRELFIRDFMNSNNGMFEQVTIGEPRLEPFVEAHGYQNGPKTNTEEAKAGMQYLLRDLFGLLPFDLRMKIYRMNRANTRGLTVPISVPMIERLNGLNVFAAFYIDDLVARKNEFHKLAAPRTSINHAKYFELDGNHTSTNNPYKVGFMATKLAA